MAPFFIGQAPWYPLQSPNNNSVNLENSVIWSASPSPFQLSPFSSQLSPMDIINRNSTVPFTTKDGSEIRELLAYRNSAIRNQTLPRRPASHPA